MIEIYLELDHHVALVSGHFPTFFFSEQLTTKIITGSYLIIHVPARPGKKKKIVDVFRSLYVSDGPLRTKCSAQLEYCSRGAIDVSLKITGQQRFRNR
jgi:hypothetical protein